MAARKTGNSTAKPGAKAQAPGAVDKAAETKAAEPTKPATKPQGATEDAPGKAVILLPPNPGHRAPTVLSARREADGNITVRWNDDSFQVTITRYLVQVWRGSRFSNGSGGYVFLEETPVLERVAQPSASALTFPPAGSFYGPDSRYSVTVLSYSSANPSGIFGSFAVLAGYQETPAISAVTCDGRTVTVTWSDATTETKPDFYLITFQGPGGTETWRTPSSLPMLRFSFVPAQAIDLPGKAIGLPSPTYTVQVAGQYSGSATPGPASAAVGVVFKTITPTVVVNSGTELKVQWQDPAEAGVTSVRVAVWEGDRLVGSQAAAVNAGLAVLTRQAGVASQSVTLQLLGTATAGPVGPQVGIIAGAPALRSVEGGAGELRIGWTQVVEPAVTGYEISVPGVTGVFSTPDAEIRLPLDLAGLGSGQLTLSARGPVSIGPATSFGALTAAPVLTGVGINASGELTATWTPPAGSPVVAGTLGFELAVWSGGVKVASQFHAQNATSGSVPGALTAGRSYTARVRMVSQAVSPVARGPWSAEVPILVEIPALLSAVYDGQVLALAWTAVSEPGVEAYDVAVLASGDRAVASARSSETRLALPLELTGALAGALGDEEVFDALVTPRGSFSAGRASARLRVFQRAPRITAVRYDAAAGRITADWTLPARRRAEVVELAAFEGDAIAARTLAGYGSQGILNLQLDATRGFTLRARIVETVGAAATAGPWTPPAPLVAFQPTLTHARYDGQTLELAWTPATDRGVTGYRVLIEVPGPVPIEERVSGPAAVLWLDLAAAGLPTSPFPGQPGRYSVKVAALAGFVQGPDSAAVTVMALAPAITAVRRENNRLRVDWRFDTAPDADRTELALFEGGAVARTATDVSGTTGSFDATLEDGRDWTVRARIVKGVAWGPWSAPVAALGGPPQIVRTAFDGDQLAVEWTPVAGRGVEAYRVRLYADGTLAQEVRVTGEAYRARYGAVLAALPGAPARPTLAVEVAAVGLASEGPASARVTLLTLAPEITGAAWSADGGSVVATWNVPTLNLSGSPLYELALFDGGSFVRSSTQGNSAAQGTLAGPFGEGRDLALRARVLLGSGTGAWSPAVALPTSRPALLAAAMDRETLRLAWSAAPEPAVQAYRVEVLAQGTPVWTGRVAGTALALPRATFLAVDPAPGTLYSARVTAVAPLALGPVGAAATLLLAAPEITQVSTAAAIAVSWRLGGQVPPGAAAELALWDGGSRLSGTVINGGQSPGVLPLPTDAGRDYRVAVRLVLGPGAGPWSAPVAVLGGPPQITRTAFDGEELAVAWTPVAGRGVEAYRVRLYADGALAQEARASGPAYVARYGAVLAALPGAPPRPTLAVEVAAVGFATEGVASSRATLLTLAPEITGAAWSADGGPVVATWNVPPLNLPGSPLYELALFDGGSFVRSSTQGNSAAQGTLAGPFGDGRDLALRARLLLGSGTGAWSPAVALPTSRPAILAAAMDGAALHLAWTAAPETAVRGYRVDILAQGAPIWTGRVAGTALALPRAAFLAADPTPGTLYSARVTAVAPLALGPVGAAATLLLAAPEITQVSTAAAVTVSWRIGGPPPPGAAAELALADGGSRLSGTVINGAQSPGVLPLPTDAGRDYGVAVRLVLGPAAGPWSARVPVLVGQPAIDQADYDGTRLELRWSAVTEPGVLAYDVTLAGPAPIATFRTAGTALSRRLTLPLSANLTAAVKAVGPRSDGRPGTAVAVVAGAPEITAVRYIASGPARVEADWQTAAAPAGAGFELALFDGGAQLASASGTNPAGGSLTATLVAGRSYTVRCRLTLGTSRGPWSGAAPVIVGQPAVRRTAYDGKRLTVEWDPVSEPGVLAYRVAIRGTGGDLAAGTFAGGSAAFELALPAGAATANVTAVGAAATGPQATAAFSVPARAALTTASWQGGRLNATWAPQSGVTAFRLDLAVGMVQVASFDVPDGAATFTAVDAPLAAGAPAALTVTALAGAIAGPPSNALAVVTRAPELTEVLYDGQTLTASWTPVEPPDPRLPSTYRLTVTRAGGTAVLAEIATGVAHATLPIALAEDGIAVAVQAEAGPSRGPASAPVDPLAGPAALFFSRDGAVAPYLFLSTRRPGQPGTGVVALSFPDLFLGAPPAGSPPAGAFTLDTLTGGASPRYAVVTADSVWRFDDPAHRAQLWSDLLAFLGWLEPAARPGAVPFVRRALALGLPLTFAETLLFRYGFQPASGYVDLVPGMRLRLDSEAYQLVPGADPADLNGFVSTGSATYDLTFGPAVGNALPLAFDAFLSRLSGTAIDAGSGGAGGILDLYGTGGSRPYYRLFYPAHLPPASAQGYSDPSRNVALVGASRLADLEAVTASYLAERNFHLAAGLGASVFYFRGRLAALPRIEVTIDGEPAEVPLGTTLGQLLAGAANLPFGGSGTASKLTLERPLPGVVDARTPAADASPAAVSASARVSFADAPVAPYASGETWLDLPLLGGDRLTVFGDRS